MRVAKLVWNPGEQQSVPTNDIKGVLRQERDEKRGKCSSSICLMISMEAATFIHENSRKKGKANLNALTCSQWVNNNLKPSNDHPPNLLRMTSMRTATYWLHQLGFVNKVVRRIICHCTNNNCSAGKFYTITGNDSKMTITRQRVGPFL